MVSKRTDAAYLAGRNRNWIKVKCGCRQEFVIGGFTEPSGSRVAFGALLLGVYDGQQQFHFVGRTGTGFSERSLKELHKRLTALEQMQSPFMNTPRGVDARGVHWVKPRWSRRCRLLNGRPKVSSGRRRFRGYAKINPLSR